MTQKLDRTPSLDDCYACLGRLTDAVVDYSTNGNDALKKKALDAAKKALAQTRESGITAIPEGANRIFRAVREVTGVENSHADFKKREMALAKKAAEPAWEYMAEGIRVRVSFAALGNSLDFFTDAAVVLNRAKLAAQKGLPFFWDDIEKLDAFVKAAPRNILYLTDNAGEIFFDKPLFEYLSGYAEKITLVSKKGPALNDLQIADLPTTGIAHCFPHTADTGTDGMGVDWGTVPESFVKMLESADLIISKGMGNWESLYPRKLATPVFFIFKAKCEPLRECIHAPEDAFLAYWRDAC